MARRKRPSLVGPANNCQFRMILKIILKKEGVELQASSSKQRLTAGVGYDRMYLERNIMEHELKRIADALEEVIRMVKLDQEAAKKRWEYKPEEKDSE
jgi:transcriptional antiterminator Rof (Rho-off)